MCKKADVDMSKRAGELTDDEASSKFSNKYTDAIDGNNLCDCWMWHHLD